MELRKFQTKEVVVGMICDMCNQNCTKDTNNPDFGYEHGTLSANWGYYSNGRDLTEEECHLCESCFDKIRQFIISNGGKVRKIKVSSFQSTGPSFHKKSGVDYLKVPGIIIPPSLRKEIIDQLDQIKQIERTKEIQEDEMFKEYLKEYVENLN